MLSPAVKVPVTLLTCGDHSTPPAAMATDADFLDWVDALRGDAFQCRTNLSQVKFILDNQK